MSQAAFLQDMDAAIFGAFAGVGLADAALFKAGGAGAGTACTVIVDRNAQFFDDVQQVAGRRITIDLQKAEIANSARGDTVTIGSEVFTLADRADTDDESVVRWVVVP